eukprot:Skav208034  [mRNA]  locus=scaffold2540:56162:56443:- [translate_table: standard]
MTSIVSETLSTPSSSIPCRLSKPSGFSKGTSEYAHPPFCFNSWSPLRIHMSGRPRTVCQVFQRSKGVCGWISVTILLPVEASCCLSKTAPHSV